MTPGGGLMKPEDWDAGFGRSIGMFLNGNGIRGTDTRGQRVVDDSFLLLFNAHDEGMDWVLPPEEFAPAWRLVIDTSGVPELIESIPGGGSVPVASKGLVVLQALAAVEQPPGVVPAAAAVPTFAPVPVPMRPEARPGDDSATAPAESRASSQVSDEPAPAAEPRTEVSAAEPVTEPPTAGPPPAPPRKPGKKKS
jgi:glycogen operon protein